MLTKKFYISIRAYGFLISQLLLPAFFVILGNVLAISGSGAGASSQDPKRLLTLDNSALFVDNMTLFYAQLGDPSIDNISDSFIFSVRDM